ncbi:MAG: contractile injection system protein, VgrG/Pvc8 family [Kofleriaceae bacterium]
MAISKAGAVDIDVTVAGTPVEDEDLRSFVINRDLNQPDECVAVLGNQDHRYNKAEISKGLEVKLKESGKTIFVGEIVGLKPLYKGMSPTTIAVHGYNKMHSMLRGRKSMTFSDKTDKQIITEVAQKHGLTVEWDGPTVSHKLVYQHNQTDLEFCRTRAARVGCNLWCVDTKLYCKVPKLDGSEVATLQTTDMGAAHQLRMFSPRLNSGSVVKKVVVKGWNPEKKELITGEAESSGSKLGSEGSVQGASSYGQVETFECSTPVWTPDEAKALAKARLLEHELSYITGSAETIGNGDFDLATLVKFVINPNGQDRFNGKYFITGVTHRYSQEAKDGFLTELRIARDGQTA